MLFINVLLFHYSAFDLILTSENVRWSNNYDQKYTRYTDSDTLISNKIFIHRNHVMPYTSLSISKDKKKEILIPSLEGKYI